jgi:hypothetical protein
VGWGGIGSRPVVGRVRAAASLSLPLLLCCGLRCWRRLAVLACCAACGRSALGSVEGPQCCTRVGGPTGCSRLCTVSWTSVLFKQRLRSIKSPCRVQRVPHVKGKGLFTAALSAQRTISTWRVYTGNRITGKDTGGSRDTNVAHTGHAGTQGHTDHTDEPHNHPNSPTHSLFR